MQFRPIMNAKVSSHDTVKGLDNGSIHFAGMECPLEPHKETFSLRLHTFLHNHDGMKIVVRHFDESVQEFSTSI